MVKKLEDYYVAYELGQNIDIAVSASSGNEAITEADDIWRHMNEFQIKDLLYDVYLNGGIRLVSHGKMI